VFGFLFQKKKKSNNLNFENDINLLFFISYLAPTSPKPDQNLSPEQKKKTEALKAKKLQLERLLSEGFYDSI